jgi:tetratricopeptide (TPR) repeat protein
MAKTARDTIAEAAESGTPPSGRPSEELVPVWLAALVLVLLLALVGVAGYVIRARFAGTAPRTAADIAVLQAQKAVAARPTDVQGRLDLGFAYQQDGKYPEAIAEYDTVIRTDPKNTAALYNKGMVYFQLQDPAKAETLLWDVLKVSKTHVLAAKALGDYYAGKKEYRSLVVAVKPAADARPDMADLQYLMGLAYENLGHRDWAIGRYQDALKYVPDLPEAHAGLKRLGVEK